MLSDGLKKWFLNLCRPVISCMILFGIKPNWLTTAGLVCGLIAGFLFAFGLFVEAGIAVALSGLCDALDGSLARISKNTTRFGMFYDSVLDRYSEVAVFIGLSFYFGRKSGMLFEQLLADVSLAGSLLVSYTRARAEGIGEKCTIGILQRPERILAIVTGALLTGITDRIEILVTVLVIIAFFTNITALQRLLYIKKNTQ